jgi:hypothetical protein
MLSNTLKNEEKKSINYNITLLKNCRSIIFFGVILIINLLALFICIDNNNIFFDLKFIDVQLQLYIPKWTDSFCKKDFIDKPSQLHFNDIYITMLLMRSNK